MLYFDSFRVQHLTLMIITFTRSSGVWASRIQMLDKNVDVAIGTILCLHYITVVLQGSILG